MTNEERLAKIARWARDAAMSASPEPRYKRLLDDIETLAAIPPEPLTLTGEPAPMNLWLVCSGTMTRIIRARDTEHALQLHSSRKSAAEIIANHPYDDPGTTIAELSANGEPGIILELNE